MKENTKQILKVSICTLMALVLFAGVILMCIYFAFDTSNDSIANAYTDEEVGVSNLAFTVDDGFYIRNLNNEDNDFYDRFINYYTYFIPSIMESGVEFFYSYRVGFLRVNYTTHTNRTESTLCTLWLEISQWDEYISFYLMVSEYSDLYFFSFTYDFEGEYLDEFYLDVYSSETDDIFYVDFSAHPEIEGTAANQFASAIIGGSDFVYSIDSFEFDFYNFVNLGCLISPNETFASPPVVMPVGVYDDNLQDRFLDGLDVGYDEGYEIGYHDGYNVDAKNYYEPIIEELREELRYYESLELNLSTIDVFNPSRMKSSTFIYDGVTYTSNSIVSTDDGWEVYSSTYHNEELPPNYGVGFSLFLPESISNTKFYVYGDITGWYNYTYCSEPDEQGNQQCYQVSDMITNISVGYRNQNGNIVKVGTFMSNLPGVGGVDFFIDSPTNEIVFFVENCNLMEVGRGVQVIYYQYDTQSIYDDGYETGKSQGIKIGREEGYYEGVADANDYSFFSLFTSVFDAPITAIVGKWGDSDGDGVYQREGGMLNFYIPGLDINFAPFLLSLFTIAIIILVIRFVMARKS